jgi:hypothetical protein
MRRTHRVGLGAVVGVAGMLAVGAPLLAQGGEHGADHAARDQHKAAVKAAKDARTTLVASLSGKNEVSPTTGKRRAGDLDATGGATVVVKGDQVCFAITVKGLDTPSAAHIHSARAGKNGNVVVPLTQPTSGDPGASAGCVTVAADLATSIQRRPRGFYVNVHTDAFPAGAVRGQLRALPKGS